MIPHKIQLKNFLSYGAELQTIDFTPYRLIYLSGKNGHGKSALLDAMTWALWGQARKTTNAVKPDQGLLRLGQTHMIVIFDFELNGQMYRVRREFEITNNKPVAHLEFGILNPSTNELTSLTDKTIRLTQAVLEKTIRLDYESFVNSAFLRQGHANEFSQKSPKDRKDILGTILGLQQFDLLKRRAMDRAKETIAQRQAISAVHDTMTQQLSNEKEVAVQFETVGKELGEIGKNEEGQCREQEQLAKERAAFVEKQKAYELLMFKKQQHESAVRKQLEQFRVQVSRWRTVNRKQRTMPNYSDLEKQKKEGGAQLEQFQKVLHGRLQLQEKMLKCKTEFQNKKVALEQQHAANLQTLQLKQERLSYEKRSVVALQIEHAKRAQELDQQSALFLKEAEALSKNCWVSEKMQKEEAQFEKRKNMYQQFVAKGSWLRAERDVLKQKHEFAHDDNPSCPMCEQNLSASRRKFLRNKFEKQQTFITHQLSRLLRVVTMLKQLLVDQHKELAAQKELHAKREAVEKESAQRQELLKDLSKQLMAYQAQLKGVEEQLVPLQHELQKKQEEAASAVKNDVGCQALSRELVTFEKAFSELRYDEQAHKAVQKKLQNVEQQIAEYVQTQYEVHNQQELSQTISQLACVLKQQKKEAVQYQKETEQYISLSKEGELIVQKEKQLDERSRAVRAQKEQLMGKQGSLKSSTEQFAKLKKEMELHQAQIKKLNVEISDYQTIASAVGKDGIQALLIEEAIPEIEQEANYLLSKLTNNQSQIFIESLRDLKRGGSKETLDVNIADPSGIRPYELFSGGEAFRIDFALRIAISKLLARRAGTSLQTLIIDEGFGSQDEEGLSCIMDAIHRVQDDFEKVIVVSHLPSMREQFPVHFMVHKGANGSRVQIIEQG